MFGQIVIGPPGSGKSTYCHGMHQFMSAIGRQSCVVNLDPANDRLPYPVSLDIRDFVTLEEVMEEHALGPNGGLMYALEQLSEAAIDEFVSRVGRLNGYVLFDCPGQVELFTHHNALYKIFRRLSSPRHLDLRLCVVSLVDSIYLTSPSSYVSILLLSLRAMLQMELPHVNVVSKIDMLKNYGPLPFQLDYYTEVQDLKYLTPHLERESNSVLGRRFVRLTELIGELVEDFNLVSFEVLSVENKQSMINLLSVIDKSNGYSFGDEIGGDTIWSEATRQGGLPGYKEIDVHERWIEHKEEFDAEETRAARERGEGEGESELDEDAQWQRDVEEWEAARK
ncbi:GPN-loop GTPase 2 [[Candida] zeylanoides]